MKFVSLSVFLATIIAGSACAPVMIHGKISTEPVETYTIVSIDTSVCGKIGTITPNEAEAYVEFIGSRTGGHHYVNFVFEEPNNSRRVITSDVLYYGNYIAFKFQGIELIGTFNYEKREDGEYLVMHFPADSDSLAWEEIQLAHYRGYEGVGMELLIKEQEEKIARLKRGFEWVLKKKSK